MNDAIRSSPDERNRLVRLSLRASPIGNFEWDIATGAMYWSADLERMYGLEAGTFEGTFAGWRKRCEPEDVERISSEILEILGRRQDLYDYELRAILPDGTRRWLRVADSGEGMAPAFLPHVFDRFRQADASTTRRHGGLGLGLAISKQIVELHGGSIRASSSGVNAGAAFIVSLPLAALRRVRALGAGTGGDIAAVALTAYARAEDRVRAIRAGFQMHVAKPVEPVELLTMVASLAGRT